jgi:hypothetical protein
LLGQQLAELPQLDQGGAGVVEEVALGLCGVAHEETMMARQELEVRRLRGGIRRILRGCRMRGGHGAHLVVETAGCTAGAGRTT